MVVQHQGGPARPGPRARQLDQAAGWGPRRARPAAHAGHVGIRGIAAGLNHETHAGEVRARR